MSKENTAALHRGLVTKNAVMFYGHKLNFTCIALAASSIHITSCQLRYRCLLLKPIMPNVCAKSVSLTVSGIFPIQRKLLL